MAWLKLEAWAMPNKDKPVLRHVRSYRQDGTAVKFIPFVGLWDGGWRPIQRMTVAADKKAGGFGLFKSFPTGFLKTDV